MAAGQQVHTLKHTLWHASSPCQQDASLNDEGFTGGRLQVFLNSTDHKREVVDWIAPALCEQALLLMDLGSQCVLLCIAPRSLPRTCTA